MSIKPSLATRVGASRRLIVALAFAAVLSTVTSAGAISRLDASGMSCFGLQDAIARRGEAIVYSRSTFSGRRLYERYVAHRGFCYANEVIQYRTVATRDTPRCTVQRCILPLNDDDDFWRFR